MIEGSKFNLTKQEIDKIYSFFNDPNIAGLLAKSISDINDDREASSLFHNTISIQDGHLYIYLTKILNRSDTTDNSQDHREQIDSAYAIRLNKKFPVAGVRIYPLKNSLQPRIFDTRDLMYEILGDIWSYKNRLLQVVSKIDNFEKKLVLRNEKHLPMQKTGQFQMGDIFTLNELTKFASLETFRDLMRQQDGSLIGTSETHFLTFKPVSNKTKTYFQITRACDLQCIHEIHYSKAQNEIVITLYKYKSIKNFNQYEKICRQYRFQNCETFLRNILKHITKFQKIEINLETATQWKNEEDFLSVNKKINECKELEQQFEKSYDYERKDSVFSRLGKNYQKLIEYFSARASCYYLIYVNKLNNLYATKNN